MWGKENLYQDRQLVLLGIRDTLHRFAFSGESGLQRNASAFDSVDFAPALFVGSTLFLPHHLSLNAYYQKDTRFPDFGETHILRIGRITFPNEELKAEKRQKMEMNLEYKLSKYFFYMAGYKYEEVRNPIMPYWALQNADSLKPLPADSAFKWANAQSSWNNELFWRLGFELGNWRFYAERGKTILRSPVINVPARYYKGAVYWSNRFVQKRLKVSVQLDADWFGSRHDYGLENDTLAIPTNLRNYLWLNFKSSMQIQSFTIYSKIENMNHSLMEPETGYTPPGIRFAYGIEWTLGD
jgi:outer membrane cobalamin receptor